MELVGKKVLVTGADGFIGSHLVERLVAEGAEVTALAQYNSFNNWGWLEDIPVLAKLKVVTGDVRDAHFCMQLVEGIEVVFHLASLIAIPYSYSAPDSYIDTNVKGTLYMCQAAHAHGVSKFIQTSTSEVYGTARYVPIDEAHPLSAQSPYSATKIAADAVATSFYNAFKLPVYVARPFNTYGPRQSARAVIPAVIIQIASGAKEISLGDTTPIRDFTFVTDTCEGFIKIARLDQGEGNVFNIGTNTEISVGDLVEEINNIMGSSIRVKCDDQRMRPEKSEVFRLRCDNRKLKEMSGFEPRVTLREGLTRTVEWLQRNLSKYKGNIYNV